MRKPRSSWASSPTSSAPHSRTSCGKASCRCVHGAYNVNGCMRSAHIMNSCSHQCNSRVCVCVCSSSPMFNLKCDDINIPLCCAHNHSDEKGVAWKQIASQTGCIDWLQACISRWMQAGCFLGLVNRRSMHQLTEHVSLHSHTSCFLLASKWDNRLACSTSPLKHTSVQWTATQCCCMCSTPLYGSVPFFANYEYGHNQKN